MPPPNEKTITLRISRFLHYVLTAESVSVGREEAMLLEALEVPAIHIQWTELDSGKPLNNPILWQKNKWLANECYRAEVKKQSELRRSALSKLHDNIKSACKYLTSKTGLKEEQIKFAAEKMVLEGNLDFLKQVGIELTDRTEEEKHALNYSTYEKIK